MTEIRQRPAPAFGPGAIELFALQDGVEAGREILLPLEIAVKGTRYPVVAGSDLRVDGDRRSGALGLKLPAAMCAAAPAGIAVAAAASRQAQPVYEFLGYTLFKMKRYAVPLDGRRHFGFCLAAAIGLYRALLASLVAGRTRALTFEKVDPDDRATLAAAAALIAADPHPCAEVHDAAWLADHLHRSFTGKPLEMTAIRRAGRLVGFVMTKTRRRATLRHLKDVSHAQVVEWQFAPEVESLAGWALVRVALALRAQAEIVEISSDDVSVHRLLKHLGWRAVDFETYLIGLSAESPLAGEPAVRVQANWRLRPAMGDNGLS